MKNNPVVSFTLAALVSLVMASSAMAKDLPLPQSATVHINSLQQENSFKFNTEAGSKESKAVLFVASGGSKDRDSCPPGKLYGLCSKG